MPPLTRLEGNTVQTVSVLWQEEDGARKHVVFDPSTQARKQIAVDSLKGRKSRWQGEGTVMPHGLLVSCSGFVCAEQKG